MHAVIAFIRIYLKEVTIHVHTFVCMRASVVRDPQIAILLSHIVQQTEIKQNKLTLREWTMQSL